MDQVLISGWSGPATFGWIGPHVAWLATTFGRAPAYSPDLPGCVATGATPAETKGRMQEAIDLHLRGLREDLLPIPEPSAVAEYVEVGP